MTVAELVEKLNELPQDFPVFVMNDNGCRDPGYDEASSVVSQYSTWHKKNIVFIDSYGS